MSDPFRIDGPAVISFSGGRTSARMLKGIIDAHGGTLPENIVVGFCNTGKEREATLRFVYECEVNWNVKVHWLEFETDLRSVGAEGRFVEVGYNSASRKGEPFERLINRKQTLPSTATGRLCTAHLKVQVLHDFAETFGFKQGDYLEVVGLRADEAHRKARLTTAKRNVKMAFAFPLIDAGVRKGDVLDFWKLQPFDLRLHRGLGNCDHCPFISAKNRIARARIDPVGVEQWARWELERDFRMGHTFSFVEILGMAASAPTLIPDDDADGECGAFCS